MQDLNDLYFFAKVVEQGGFTAASRVLGIPKSRLSRRLSELEGRLGTRLLQRNTRGITLTDLGNRYYQHCQVMLAAADAAHLAITSSLAEPSGQVRISCLLPVARDKLAPVLPDFLERYPHINLDFVLTNRRVNLLEEGIDVAIRVRAIDDEDPNLATRRLIATSSLLVAAPALIAQILTLTSLEHPRALAKLPFLGATEQDQRLHLPLIGPHSERYELVTKVRLAIEEFTVRKHAAIRGLGITMLPIDTCREEIAAGSLVQILPAWSPPNASLQIVYPTQRGLLPAVRVFIDFLIEHFQSTAENLPLTNTLAV